MLISVLADASAAIVVLVVLIGLFLLLIPSLIAWQRGAVGLGVLLLVVNLLFCGGAAFAQPQLTVEGHATSVNMAAMFWYLVTLISAASCTVPERVGDVRRLQIAVADLGQQVQVLRREIGQLDRRAHALESWSAENVMPTSAPSPAAALPPPQPTRASSPRVVTAPPPVQTDMDATPLFTPTVPVVSDTKEVGAAPIKVRCKSCNKKFSGLPSKLASIKACPACKVSPFDMVDA